MAHQTKHTPWNKGNKQSPEELARKKAAHYRANRESILAKVKTYQKGNKAHRQEYMRWYMIEKKYGVTKAQWLVMFANQKECCGLCKRHHSEFSKGLVVDHCHATGKVRRLLCDGCNIIMGVVDNEEKMKAALEYKKEFS